MADLPDMTYIIQLKNGFTYVLLASRFGKNSTITITTAEKVLS